MKTIIMLMVLIIPQLSIAQSVKPEDLIDFDQLKNRTRTLFGKVDRCICETSDYQHHKVPIDVELTGEYSEKQQQCRSYEDQFIPINPSGRKGNAERWATTSACGVTVMNRDAMIQITTAPTPGASGDLYQQIRELQYDIRALQNRTPEVRYVTPESSPSTPYYDPSPNDGVPMPNPNKKDKPGFTR